MVALPPPWFPKMPATIVELCIVFGFMLVALGFGLMGIGSWPALPEPKGPYAFLLGGLMALLAGGLWLAYDQLDLHPRDKNDTIATELKQPPVTMEELFDTDFLTNQHGFTTWKDQVLINEIETQKEFMFHRKIFYNLQTRSKFLSFYIPSGVKAFGVIQYVYQNLDMLLTKGGFRDFYVRDVGNPFPTTGKDLVFSRVIYLYFSDNIPTNEKAFTEEEFRKLNIIVHIYDEHYLLAKSLDAQTLAAVNARRKVVTNLPTALLQSQAPPAPLA